MKKIVLSLIFVFVAIANISATTKEVKLIQKNNGIELSPECDAVYFAVRDAVFAITGDMIQAINSAIQAEENCLDGEEEIRPVEGN